MDKAVVIRCFDKCYYTLMWPAFFLDRPKATMQKLFKWLFSYEWYRENEETIAFLDREFPILFETIEKEDIPKAKEEWGKRSKAFQDGYLNTDSRFFPPGTKEEYRKERERRKAHNDRLMRRVKEAKAEYERQEKRLIRAKVIYEIYKSEKR